MLKHTMGLAIAAGGLCLLGWKQVSPQDAESQRAAAQACFANQKQVAVALMMYTQDYDETYPRKATSYKAQIMPYVKNQQVFHCPLDAPNVVSYTFNPNLAGMTIVSIVSPSQTVLLYEGKNMQMNFRHEGRAIVAYADGHVKMISPDEAKNLFWYPAGKTPKPAAKPTTKIKKKSAR